VTNPRRKAPVRAIRSDTPQSVAAAAASGDGRQLLLALRDEVARAITEGCAARDLASLSRRLIEISRELAELDVQRAAEEPKARRAAARADEPWREVKASGDENRDTVTFRDRPSCDQADGHRVDGLAADRRHLRRQAGLTLDGWQDGAGRLILARRADGRLAATIGGVGMSLPRQVGKTTLLIGMIFGLCLDNPGLFVIWTSHHSRTTQESFLVMQSFTRRSAVKPLIAKVFLGAGDEEIRFVNGSRVLFGAREHGFGRGLSGVDVIVFDERQILSERALRKHAREPQLEQAWSAHLLRHTTQADRQLRKLLSDAHRRALRRGQ
jgi:hypothetical protein